MSANHYLRHIYASAAFLGLGLLLFFLNSGQASAHASQIVVSGSGWTTAGTVQEVPDGYGLTAIGFGSDDHRCFVYIKTAPVRPDGSVDFSQVTGWQATACGIDMGGTSAKHADYVFDHVAVGWTWGANTSGGWDGNDTWPAEECYWQQYAPLSDINNRTGYYAPYNGTCDEGGYTQSMLRMAAYAPSGHVIVAVGLSLANDASVDMVGMHTRHVYPQCSISSFTADNFNPPFGQTTTLRFTLSGSFPWSISEINSADTVSPSSGTGSGGSANTGATSGTQTYRLACGSATRDVTVVHQSPPPAPIVDLKAAPNGQNPTDGPVTVTPGTNVRLQWTIQNTANSCTASGSWNGSKGTSAYNEEWITNLNTAGTYTYNIQCSNAQGSDSDSVTVNVQPQGQAPTVDLTGSPNGTNNSQGPITVSPGTNVRLEWRTTNNPTSCTATGAWSGSKGTSAYNEEWITNLNTAGTYTYNIQCSNAQGSASDSLTIIVATSSISASPNPIQVCPPDTNGVTTIRVSAAFDFVVRINDPRQGIGVDFTGRELANPNWSGTTGDWVTNGMVFYLIRYSDQSNQGSVTVTHTTAGCPVVGGAPTCSLSASPSSGTAPLSGTLTWTTANNPTSCTATGGWSGSKSTSGGSQGYGPINSTTSYGLSCSNAFGSGTCSRTVTVSAAGSPPTCSISASPSSGSAPLSGTLFWSSTNATSCTATGGWSGFKSTSGSQSYGPINSSTNYGLSCSNAFGSSSCSTTVSVNASSPVQCSPFSQTVQPGQYASLFATGGSGSYFWSAPGGFPSTGFSSFFQTNYASVGDYFVTVTSGASGWSCIVSVRMGSTNSDLTVTDFRLTDASGSTKSTFAAGERIYPSVTIRNMGSGTAMGSTGYFYISVYSNSPAAKTPPASSDVGVWVKEPNGIAPGETKTYSITTNSAYWTNDGGNQNNWTMATNGSYTARVFVDSFNYVTELNESNNQATFAYNIGVLARPAITVTPPTLNFSATQGGSAPPAQNLTITNTGDPGSQLNWRAQTNQNWCRVNGVNSSGSITGGPLNKDASSTVSVSVDPPSNVGTFTCTVSVSDPAASNSPQVATITYTVAAAAQPAISVSPTTFNFSGISGSSVPPAQNLTITNTGDPGSQLNWRAQTNQNWCRVNGVNSSGSITGGPLNKDASSTVSVSVDPPSNVGTFICTITVSDVGGVAASKTATVTYTVRPGDPGGGNPSNVTASNATCEKISLSWTAGAGASSYNVYRNTVNSVPAAPYASGIAATSYIDNSPTPTGTKFYYWVEAVGGGLTSPNKVAANTNASGGIAANICNPPPNNDPGPGPVYNSSNDPLTVPAGGAACSQVRVTWTDRSTNETGFKIFRGTTSNAAAATLVQTVAANTSSFIYTPPDTNPYYYFIAATNAGGDSTRVAESNNPVAAIACQANLVGSDKDIVAVNASSLATNSCGSTDPLPATVSLKRGDKLKFSVNVCNQNGEAPATAIIVTDRLINLKEPVTGWNARFNGNPISPTVSGSAPTQTLVFDLSAFPVPKGAIYSLIFEAEIDVPAGYAGSTSRLQNSVKIDYRKDASSPAATTVDFATPLLLFNVKAGTPEIIEVSP